MNAEITIEIKAGPILTKLSRILEIIENFEDCIPDFLDEKAELHELAEYIKRIALKELDI